MSFHFPYWDFIPTMVRSMSTTRWPRCWRNCARSSPNRDPAAVTTTLWWKPRNGAVVRKNIGYQWLPPSHAGEVHAFYQAWFNPYLNYHRPCGFATVKTDAKGKAKKVYDVYATPYERLKSL